MTKARGLAIVLAVIAVAATGTPHSIFTISGWASCQASILASSQV